MFGVGEQAFSLASNVPIEPTGSVIHGRAHFQYQNLLKQCLPGASNRHVSLRDPQQCLRLVGSASSWTTQCIGILLFRSTGVLLLSKKNMVLKQNIREEFAVLEAQSACCLRNLDQLPMHTKKRKRCKDRCSCNFHHVLRETYLHTNSSIKQQNEAHPCCQCSRPCNCVTNFLARSVLAQKGVLTFSETMPRCVFFLETSKIAKPSFAQR